MPKRILVVDDEPQNVTLITSRLKVNGYEVISAFDGQEALDKVHQEKPDLIILDILLPKINGYKVCNMLASDSEYKHIPIVMLTGLGEAKNIGEGMNNGAVAYVTKPFKAEILLGIIKATVG